MTKKIVRVGLLGGAFDPPHKGHLEVSKAALKADKVDTVWFLPCWQHAFGKKPEAFHHRAIMSYFTVMNEENITVNTVEADLMTTYSIDILEYIQKLYEDSSFRLIMGTDNYWKMDKWKNKDKVLKIAPPIWVDRPHIKRIEDNFITCKNKTSSTKIRELLKQKRTKTKLKEMLVPKVLDYIKEHKLYGVE